MLSIAISQHLGFDSFHRLSCAYPAVVYAPPENVYEAPLQYVC